LGDIGTVLWGPEGKCISKNTRREKRGKRRKITTKEFGDKRGETRNKMTSQTGKKHRDDAGPDRRVKRIGLAPNEHKTYRTK